MKELDNFTLDQKSWAFLNIIGQTPNSFSVAAISIGPSFTPFVSGGPFQENIAAGVSDYFQRWFVGGIQKGQLFWDNTATKIQIGAAATGVGLQLTYAAGLVGLELNSTTGAAIFVNKIFPGTDAGATQSASGLYAGTGAPNNANGGNGDVYIRSDGGALTTIYQRRAGAWVGIV